MSAASEGRPNCVTAEMKGLRMRYQVFNQRVAAVPKFSAPWLWLARHVCSVWTLRWEYCCLVDSTTGEVVMEWAKGQRALPSASGTGQGGPTLSHIRLGRDGHAHEFIAGTTAYGKGCAPQGGHKPLTTIEVQDSDIDHGGPTA